MKSRVTQDRTFKNPHNRPIDPTIAWIAHSKGKSSMLEQKWFVQFLQGFDDVKVLKTIGYVNICLSAQDH